MHISTHTLRKEGDVAAGNSVLLMDSISTHTLRKEGDLVAAVNELHGDIISTHTLRKEGDDCTIRAIAKATDFNPHPPQGG